MRFLNYFIKRSYLRKRGWKQDNKGWYQSFDPDVPKNSFRRNKVRAQQREDIGIEEAYKLAMHSDPNSKSVWVVEGSPDQEGG